MNREIARLAVRLLAVAMMGMHVQAAEKAIPKLLDLGATACIPCKMMAPILEKMKKDYAGILEVEFIDVWKNPKAGAKYGIEQIPTQIFFDAEGKERFRHVGFFGKEDILAKWKELGYDLAPRAAAAKPIERWEPARPDSRAKEAVCDFCDGDVGAKTRVAVKTDKGDMALCSPHCYFIMYSCLTQDKTGLDKKVSFTDWSTGKLVPARQAAFVYGLDERSGRPTIRAYASRAAAAAARAIAGGSVLDLATLQRQELAARCGFCDRAVYPEDAALVKAGGIHTWGCCAHCSLGIAARTGLDIEIHQPDGLTGEPIVIKTLKGSVASIEPKNAVAWFGMRKKLDGSWGSAGCFHQGDFVSAANLGKWLEAHPLETGKQITIQQALASKMKLTPAQISKACKVGECAPK
jgi:thioredoxin 1